MSSFSLELNNLELWGLLLQFSPCHLLGFINPVEGLSPNDTDQIYQSVLKQLEARDLIRIRSTEIEIEESIKEMMSNLINSHQTLIISEKSISSESIFHFDFCQNNIINWYEIYPGKYVFEKITNLDVFAEMILKIFSNHPFEVDNQNIELREEIYLALGKKSYETDLSGIDQVLEIADLPKTLHENLFNLFSSPITSYCFVLVNKKSMSEDVRNINLLLSENQIYLISSFIKKDVQYVRMEQKTTGEAEKRISDMIPTYGGSHMHRLIITLKVGGKSKTLDVPGDEIVGVLKGHIIKGLGGNLEGKQGNPINYWLETQSGNKIEDSQTLINAGIKNHDIIQIRRQTGKTSINTQEPYFDSLSSFFDDEDEEQTPEIGEQSQGDKGTSSVGGFETLD